MNDELLSETLSAAYMSSSLNGEVDEVRRSVEQAPHLQHLVLLLRLDQ